MSIRKLAIKINTPDRQDTAPLPRILATSSFIAFFLLTLGACAPQVATVDPQAQLPAPPEHWPHTDRMQTEPTAWLSSFSAPELEQLIEEAQLRNFDLKKLAIRVKSAEARAHIAGADTLPKADLNFAAIRRQTGNNATTTISNNFSLQTAFSWEIDLWNRLGYSEQAALSELGASQADRQAAEFSLAASIARSWVQLIETGRQLQLAKETELSYQQSLQIINEQYRSGLNSALDLRLARAALANAKTIRIDRQGQQDRLRRELEILLGRYPAGSLRVTEQLPELSSRVPVGLPSSLLQRRPDLQAAALRLTAANQRSAAANLNRLPIFRLTASAGTASNELYQLLDLDYLLWSLAGSIAQPLFDGGRRSAEQDLSHSQAELLLADYASTALNAYREVEVSLAAEGWLQLKEQALQTSVIETSEAKVLAEQRYLQGLEGIITLLQTRRRAFSSQIILLAVQRQRLENRINLHLAQTDHSGPRLGPTKNRDDKRLGHS